MRTSFSSVTWAAWFLTVNHLAAAQSSVETFIHSPVTFQDKAIVLRPVVYHYSVKKQPPPPPPEFYAPTEIPVVSESESFVDSYGSEAYYDSYYSQEESFARESVVAVKVEQVTTESVTTELVTTEPPEMESVDVVAFVPEEVDVIQTLDVVDQIEENTETNTNLFNVEETIDLSTNEIMEASVGLNYVVRKCKKSLAVAKVNEL